MDEMEKKLAKYRAKKAREEKINEYKTKIGNVFTSFWKKRQKTSNEEPLVPPDVVDDAPLEDATSVCSDEESLDCCTWVDLFYYALWFILWVILYIIFIELQFGTVFFVISGIIFIFLNTRTRPKRSGEVSAYSVFNRNCESIDGTLKAEQFEREIRYGRL